MKLTALPARAIVISVYVLLLLAIAVCGMVEEKAVASDKALASESFTYALENVQVVIPNDTAENMRDPAVGRCIASFYEDDFWMAVSASFVSRMTQEHPNDLSDYLEEERYYVPSEEVVDMGYALFSDFDGELDNTDLPDYVEYDRLHDEYGFLALPLDCRVELVSLEGSKATYEMRAETGEAISTVVIEYVPNSHVNVSGDNPYYLTMKSATSTPANVVCQQ